MKKINIEMENIVIGSNTVEEHKFQVLNFMNMFWDNICCPGKQECMSIDTVAYNLKYEIRKVLELEGEKHYRTCRADRACDLVTAVHINMKHVLKDSEEVLIALCKTLWEELLYTLDREFHLKYTLN